MRHLILLPLMATLVGGCAGAVPAHYKKTAADGESFHSDLGLLDDRVADHRLPDHQTDHKAPLKCAGQIVGDYCFYLGAAGESCDAVCVTHGGCDLKGTRDFAGSGGSDANCIAAIGALGLVTLPHQSWSNNWAGCHSIWGWTYWSTAMTTTCADQGSHGAMRICACAM